MVMSSWWKTFFFQPATAVCDDSHGEQTSNQPTHQPPVVHAPLYDYAVKRADPRDLRTVFYKEKGTSQDVDVKNQYASVQQDGIRYITPTDLIRDLFQMDAACFNENTLNLFSGVVDQTKDGLFTLYLQRSTGKGYYLKTPTSKSRLITFEEFQDFEALLCNVDALYRVCFQLFDLDGKGTITFDEFKHMLSCQVHAKKYPFDYESEFVKSYFGKDKKYAVNYYEFTQLIQSLNKEFVRQLFHQKAKGGHITTLQFAEIIKVGCSHKLTPYIVENMMAAVTKETGGRQVSAIYCMAFYDLLQNMGIINTMFKDVTVGNKFKQLTKEELLQASQQYPQITPLQIEILFDICTVSHPGKGKVSLVDTFKLSPKIDPLTVFSKIHEFKEKETSQDVDVKNQHYERPSEVKGEHHQQAVSMQVLQSVYRFTLGAIAGAAGAAFVYPIDLVKTRMQNQRSVLADEVLYKNSWDCFRKVIRNEGITGLYRGLVPQLIGVSPEKAIKLTTNDLVRSKFTDKDGEIRLIGEILAGGCGGGAQVLFTNPIEIVKIRMQVMGEAGQFTGAIPLVKELGLRGLYKGARACFLRDIPFSAIYFPCYAHLKTALADKNGHVAPLNLLIAAAAAGVPAAYLVTPADVIKTRLQEKGTSQDVNVKNQVKARRGQQTYSSVVDCFQKVLKEEGGTAFFKGGPARIFRSSPQFGVTLLVYELLQRVFYYDFGGGYTKTQITPVNQAVSLHPDHIGGLRLAVSSFSGVETKFGLMLPKFNPAPPPNHNGRKAAV